MLFSSPVFFAFFTIYFALHVLVPTSRRMTLIICGSAIFYGYWYPFYVWVPFLQILIAWGGVIWMEKSEGRSKKVRAGLIIAALMAPLVFFKYTNFIATGVIGPLLGVADPVIDLPLPLGISFVTFTMIAYLVDVFRGEYSAVRSLATMTGYTLYFPQLIAGPILRPHQLIPQLEHPRKWLDGKFVFGILIFTVGLLKKLVIADPIAEAVDTVYRATDPVTGWHYLLAIYGFSVQIFCDFSGYTDMAIGIAMVLGVRLPQNFKRPYIAADLREFWTRWHITLSLWLRDYLYIPLGGNRGRTAMHVRNIIITMALGGLWHGASWTFILWGLAHGVVIAALHLFDRTRRQQRAAKDGRVRRWIAILFTFHFVTFTWILFRAPDLATVWTVLSGPFTGTYGDFAKFVTAHAYVLLIVGLFFVTHVFDKASHLWLATKRVHPIALWSIIALVWIMAITVSTGSSAKFIYFDF